MSRAGEQLELLKEGRRRRDAGTQRRAQRDPVFHRQAMYAVGRLAATGSTFTSDDLWAMLDAAGLSPTHSNSVGAAFHAAVAAGIIKRVGYRQSTRPAAHARVIAVYIGT